MVGGLAFHPCWRWTVHENEYDVSCAIEPLMVAWGGSCRPDPGQRPECLLEFYPYPLQKSMLDVTEMMCCDFSEIVGDLL